MSEPANDDPAESCLEWKDGILVYTGEVPPDLDIRGWIVREREARIQAFVKPCLHPDADSTVLGPQTKRAGAEHSDG